MNSASSEVLLSMFVVYANPRDYPGGFVVRRWSLSPGRKEEPDAVASFHSSLASARGRIPAGLYRLDRDRDDDPAILEVWL